MDDDPLAVVAKLASVFEQLRVRYAVGGSLASSLHGVPRATNDADIVADLRPAIVERFVAAVAPHFHVDEQMVHAAVAEHSSFNILDHATMLKIDVFVAGRDAWVAEELSRARAEEVPVGDRSATIFFASPEDTLLYKLVWYRLGGEQSERQWSDVSGVIKVQGSGLDGSYLRHWSTHLGVADLLARAIGGE